MYAQAMKEICGGNTPTEYSVLSGYETDNPQEMYLFIHNAFTIYNCAYVNLMYDNGTDHIIFNPDEASILLLAETVSCQSCKYYTPCQKCKEVNCSSTNKNGACCMHEIYELGGAITPSWESHVLLEGCLNYKNR